MELLLLLTKVYIALSVVLLMIWGASIYENSQARQFALGQLIAWTGENLTGGKIDEGMARQIFSHVEEVRRELGWIKGPRDIERLEVEMLHLYILRADLGYPVEDILEIVKEVEAMGGKGDAAEMIKGIKEQLRDRMSSGNILDRVFIERVYQHNYREVLNIVHKMQG